MYILRSLLADLDSRRVKWCILVLVGTDEDHVLEPIKALT